MIKLTVALPVWNSKEILWLALESLCNQEQVDFDWELLIMEEQINHFGAENVKEFAERLQAVRCIGLKYSAIDYRIPLPQKWKILGSKASETSKGFLLQAADCYSEPLRLRRTMDKLKEGYDWIQNRRGYYYSLHYKKLVEFDQASFGAGCRTGLNMAVAAHLLPRLPDSFIQSGVDNWFFNSVKPQKVCWIEGEMVGGVDVDGHNNISLRRKQYFNNPKPPFKATAKTIYDIIPHHIVEELKEVPAR